MTFKIKEYTAKTINELKFALHGLADCDFSYGTFEEFCDFVWDNYKFHSPASNCIKFDEYELHSLISAYEDMKKAEARLDEMFK